MPAKKTTNVVEIGAAKNASKSKPVVAEVNIPVEKTEARSLDEAGREGLRHRPARRARLQESRAGATSPRLDESPQVREAVDASTP